MKDSKGREVEIKDGELIVWANDERSQSATLTQKQIIETIRKMEEDLGRWRWYLNLLAPGANPTGTTLGQANVVRLTGAFLSELQTILFRDCASYRETADAIDGVSTALERARELTKPLADGEAAIQRIQAAWQDLAERMHGPLRADEHLRNLARALGRLTVAVDHHLKSKESGPRPHAQGDLFQAQGGNR